MQRRKLSASGISLFLKSPKAFYHRYIANLETIVESIGTFSHDRICGSLWSGFVDRFYKGMPEAENTARMLTAWQEQTHGWVPIKTQERYAEAMKTWANAYYQAYNPDDGVRDRDKSEYFVENERFVGYLDGFDSKNRYIHECKSTSQAPQLSEQLLRVQMSLQVKMYAVLTQANGAVIEFAFKSAPYGVYRAEPILFTKEQRDCWEHELNALADSIIALGDNPCNYVCNPDACTLVTRNMVAPCQYQALCLGIEGASIAFKPKTNRRCLSRRRTVDKG